MELKFFIFILSVMCVIPLTLMLMLSQKCMKACIFLLPICFWNYQSTAINFLSNPHHKGTALGFEISIIHLLALALLMAMILRQWPVKLLFPGIVFYIQYFFVCSASIFISPNKLYSGFEIVKMITFFITFLAAVNYFYITHDFESFINGLATIILINFVICVNMKYITGGRWQIAGIFPHQNSMAMFMSLTGPIFLARVLNKKESLLKTTFHLGIFLITFCSTIFSYSRGALACFPIGCVVTILMTVFFHNTTKAMIVLCAIGFLGIHATLYSLPTMIYRFEKAPESSAETRKTMATTAMNIIKEKPLLGCGINNWSNVSNLPQYNYFQPNYVYDENSENGVCETTYLLVGAECGLLGLASLLCLYFYYLFQAMYQSFKWRKTEYFYLLAGISGGFISNYLQSILEWVLKQQVNFCMLLYCFGIVAALVQSTREHTTLSRLEFIAQRKAEIQKRYEEAMQSNPETM